MEFTIDVTKLREQRRPLWMTELDITSYAEMVGGGGDIYSDRLVPDWPRHAGEELLGSEAEEAAKLDKSYSEEEHFRPKDARASLVEEAFRYVHQSE